jgi:hypothetical protein
LRKRLALIVTALLLVGVGAGIAYASIPGPDGVIHGCYKNSTPAQGALIAVDSAASCPSGYTALNWNQTGPQGPAGPPGLSNFMHAASEVYVSQTGHFAGLNCPPGYIAIDGTAAVVDDNTGELLPIDPGVGVEVVLTNGLPTGYRWSIETGFAGARHRFHIICAQTAT